MLAYYPTLEHYNNSSRTIALIYDSLMSLFTSTPESERSQHVPLAATLLLDSTSRVLI